MVACMRDVRGTLTKTGMGAGGHAHWEPGLNGVDVGELNL